MATEPAGKCDWLSLAAKHPDLVREKSLANIDLIADLRNLHDST